MKTIEERKAHEAKYIKDEFGGLVGKTVKEVRPLGEGDLKALYWEGGYGAVAFVIVFTDGSFIIPMMDEEGNGAGALMFEDKLKK